MKIGKLKKKNVFFPNNWNILGKVYVLPIFRCLTMLNFNKTDFIKLDDTICPQFSWESSSNTLRHFKTFIKTFLFFLSGQSNYNSFYQESAKLLTFIEQGKDSLKTFPLISFATDFVRRLSATSTAPTSAAARTSRPKKSDTLRSKSKNTN